MSKKETGDNDSDGEPCPWDGCERTYDTERGVKQHHVREHGVSLAGVVVECAVCGEEKRVWPSQVEEADRHFCSPREGRGQSDCERKWRSDNMSGENHPNWQGGEVPVECWTCETEKYVTPAVAEEYDRHFCPAEGDESFSECYRIWRSERMSGEGSPNWGGGKVPVECAWCGAEKRVSPSSKERHDHSFCPPEDGESVSLCRREWNSRDMSGENNHSWKGGLVEVDCAWCGDTKTVHRYRLDETGSFFCSPEDGNGQSLCQRKWRSETYFGENHPRWKGGKAPYGAGWNDAKKEQVRERDGRTCQSCGRTEEEHVESYGKKHAVHHIQKARHFDSPERRNHPDNLVTLCNTKECHWKWESMAPLRPQVSIESTDD